MLNNISWASYWYALAVLSILYYSYILLVYYRSDLVQRFQSTHPEPGLKGKNKRTNATEPAHYLDSVDPLMPAAQSLINEITAYLETTSGNKPDKQEIILSLRHIVKKYVDLNHSAYRHLINKMIQSECKDKCAIHLKDEDVKHVWMN